MTTRSQNDRVTMSWIIALVEDTEQRLLRGLRGESWPWVVVSDTKEKKT